mmetsp:Transcript_33539/g.91855  ORF Transcript_33539/g.91855 Transcript_33539/m.91855 type:complete len:235 (-) Transcript_33539:445-1149(-)
MPLTPRQMYELPETFCTGTRLQWIERTVIWTYLFWLGPNQSLSPTLISPLIRCPPSTVPTPGTVQEASRCTSTSSVSWGTMRFGSRLRKECKSSMPSIVTFETMKIGTTASEWMFCAQRTMSLLLLILIGMRRISGFFRSVVIEWSVSSRTFILSFIMSVFVTTMANGMFSVLHRNMCSTVILSTPRLPPTMMRHASGREHERPKMVVLRYFSWPARSKKEMIFELRLTTSGHA